MSNELKSFLTEILSSWQVIAVGAVVMFYILLVSYVTNFRPKVKSKTKTPAKKKTVKSAKPKGDDDDESDDKK